MLNVSPAGVLRPSELRDAAYRCSDSWSDCHLADVGLAAPMMHMHMIQYDKMRSR